MSAPTTTGQTQVAVIGAGVAGLAAACTLLERGVDVAAFEAADRPGGVVQSEARGGFLIEHGPSSMAAPPEPVDELIRSLGLDRRRLTPRPDARHRYIVRDGVPRPVPTTPAGWLGTDLLSTSAKLRLLAEPLIGSADPGAEESVAQFVRRRLGTEALDYLADPFVAGIFAGDPERLAIRHALPAVASLEAEFGSLVRGAVAKGLKGRGRPTGRTFFTFPEGLGELPRAMARRLDDRLHLNTTVTGVRRVGESWCLTGDRNRLDPLQRYDAVVLALPADRLSGLAWEGIDPAPFTRLAAIRYVPVATLTLGFRREAVSHPLDGFGMLVPRAERRMILGTVFSSSLFDGRAPAGHVTLTTLVGGARHPGLALAGQTAVRTAATADLERLLGVTGTPAFESFRCWPKAIPQYDLGHGDLIAFADQAERQWPTLGLAGSYRHGLSLGDTMMSGIATAERLIAKLAATSGAIS